MAKQWILNSTALSVVAAAALSLSACGGAGGGAAGMAPQGSVNLSLTDAPGDFDNVWITVSAVWFHTSPSADPDDAGWLKYSLSAPVSVDLLTLQNGGLSQVFGGLPLPVGTYRQILLFLAPPGATLTGSASAQQLIYNDQVNYRDGNNAEQVSPLEIVNPAQGIVLTGTFSVAAGANLSLALDFSVDRDVIPVYLGNQEDFVLKPRLAYFDLAHTGGIRGSVECADLRVAGGSGFAYDVVVKAEMPSSDGTYHAVDRETGLHIDLADNNCTFSLFPLDIPAAASSTSYDVLIRGRDMSTIIVQGVPVAAGTTAATGTSLSVDPLPLLSSGEYSANMPASTPLSPSGADVQFYQTLPGESAPYEVRFRAADPFSGTFAFDEPLSLGPIEVGHYAAGADPALASVTPNEGLGGFLPYGDAPYFMRTAASTGTLTPGVTAASFTIGALDIAPPAGADSIGGTLAQPMGRYDSGYLIVSHQGYIVATLPLGPVLAENGGLGGAYALGNLPGGSSAQSFAPGLYHLQAFVWNSAHPLLTLQRVEGSGVVNLQSGGATNVNLTVN
jgi:hypothetical protein